MTFRLGLTGSIGMGKSTTAQMFRDLGVPVWDADATVHELYQKDGAAVELILAICPDAIVDGAVDRTALKSALEKEPNLLNRIESVVHPLVADERADFLKRHADVPLVLLDMPLLFETGAEGSADAVVVVTTDAKTQRSRVMDRPGLTNAIFNQILARQMSDADKRARADYILETQTLDQTRKDVADLVAKLTPQTSEPPNA